jgi:hypothetical protein
MTELNKRKRGMIRVSIHSIIKALYGENNGFEAISMKVAKNDRSMLEITVSHDSLPVWEPGTRLKRIEIARNQKPDDE